MGDGKENRDRSGRGGRMKRKNIPCPCIYCSNMRAWSLDMGGDHDFTCKKKPPSEYGKSECDKYEPLTEDMIDEIIRGSGETKGAEE